VTTQVPALNAVEDAGSDTTLLAGLGRPALEG
jgi:hypothetical protein